MKAIKLLSGWAAYKGGEVLAVPGQVSLANAQMLVDSGDAVEAEAPKAPPPPPSSNPATDLGGTKAPVDNPATRRDESRQPEPEPKGKAATQKGQKK